jgi:glycosyltransferase involved in cell wall biosynthesis
MIYYDVTKMGAARQKSGLTRVSFRLREELGEAVRPVVWDGRAGHFCRADDGRGVGFRAADWLLTVELFNGAERPGFREFIAERPCRLAAMFHDAIPLRHPHITWPQSVERHPDYVKLLAGFDRIFAISKASRDDLAGFWAWQGVTPRAEISLLDHGADFDGSERVTEVRQVSTGLRPQLLSVGIVEPRKNQGLLLEACEALWREGVDFELHLVGRVNPHYGGPIEQRIKQVRKREPRLHYHAAASDVVLKKLYDRASAVVFPTLAEGCGLPLLEALWHGVPCVCSDLPVLRENADAGGCLTARVNDAADWQEKLRVVLTDQAVGARLRQEARARPLPRWADTARAMLLVLS